MAWVKAHIAAFGGNGDDVTIFGESAGGNSVINHLAQKASFPYYKKAIVESGAYSTGGFTAAAAELGLTAVLGKAGCTDAACLGALDAQKLLAAGNPGAWGPVVDGVAMARRPTDSIAAGDYNSAARVVIGSNRDESAFFFILDHTPEAMDEAAFEAGLASRYSAAEVRQLKAIYANDSSTYPYPSDLGPYSKYWWASMRASTDSVPGLGPCAVRWLSRLLLAGGTPAVYDYHFAHPTQADTAGGLIPGVGKGSVVVPHASEITFAFGGAALLTPGAEAQLAMRMGAYWSNFARTGDPNAGQPVPAQWPAFDAAADALLRLDVDDPAGAPPAGGPGIAVQRGLRKQACDFMEARYEHEAGRR